MKKKNRIPDFSPKPTGGTQHLSGPLKGHPPAPPKAGGVKPQSTSAKSGRRGQ